MNRTLGPLETRLFAYVQLRQLQTVSAGELAGPLQITPLQEEQLLRRLAKAGLIARVQPKIYLAPQRLPLGGKWSPGEALALNTLMAVRNGRYQVCGPGAFNRYGFNTQVPMRVYAYNNRVSGEREIGAVRLSLIKVADTRLGGADKIKTGDGSTLICSSRVRTLVDAVYDWSRFNSLPSGYLWIRNELSARRVNAAELVAMTLKYGNKGAVRRIGALLEQEGIPEELLKKLEQALPSSTSAIPFVPDASRKGALNRRWGIILNERV